MREDLWQLEDQIAVLLQPHAARSAILNQRGREQLNDGRQQHVDGCIRYDHVQAAKLCLLKADEKRDGKRID